jgi:uncharacterized protein YutE (UPF0331/DUF86 family)
MGESVINRKVDLLTDCLARVESRVPETVENLKSDIDLQELLAINIDRLIDVTLDIAGILKDDVPDIEELPAEELFPALAEHRVISPGLSERLTTAIRFRDLHMYRYAAIDWSMVYVFITAELGSFHEFARGVRARVCADRARKS